MIYKFSSLVKRSLIFLFLIVTINCSPKVYIIDKQTVLQEQASGEWPNFEESLSQSLKKKNPVMLPKATTNDSTKNKKLYKVLNSNITLGEKK